VQGRLLRRECDGDPLIALDLDLPAYRLDALEQRIGRVRHERAPRRGLPV
jgi:hypothetical protein